MDIRSPLDASKASRAAYRAANRSRASGLCGGSATSQSASVSSAIVQRRSNFIAKIVASRQDTLDRLPEPRVVNDRHANERQATPVACRKNQRRLDVSDPVPEPARVARTTVMHLVGMKDKGLPADTLPRLAAIPEGLNSQRGETYTVRVMPVRREGVSKKGRAHRLDARRASGQGNGARPFRSARTIVQDRTPGGLA
jgi:hypothetical protein